MKISIIIPCYNNEQSISELYDRVNLVSENQIFSEHIFELVFVDDGSTDQTFRKISNLNDHQKCKISIVKLTRNFGSYNAFLAGMYHAKGDCCVHLHADLQDPPELITELFEHYLKGFKLVIANRESREDPSLFSSIYHWFVQRYAIKNAPPGGFDLILFDKKIKDEIVHISEHHTNNVYLINWLGYPYVSIPYKRVKRKHGKSQWFFFKKVRLFIDTVFSFTNFPILFVRSTLFFSFILFIVSAILFVLDSESTNRITLFISSVVFLFITANCLVIGEYLTRIHETVRNRPNFVVDKVVQK